MSDLLERLRRMADTLRNTWNNEEGEAPYLEYNWRCDDDGRDVRMIWHEPEAPGDPTAYCTGISIYVADHCSLADIPLNEGEPMPEIAEVFTDGGLLLREAADRIEQLERLLEEYGSEVPKLAEVPMESARTVDQTRGRLLAMYDRGEHRQVFRLLLGALDDATLARVELTEDRSARWQAVADRVADRARAAKSVEESP